MEEEHENDNQEKNFNQDENVTRRQGRKRKRGMSRQTAEKKRRNGGKKYTSYRGKGKENLEKVLGADCNCKRQCFTRFTEDERRNIFNAFWEMKNFNLQNSYIFGCLEVKRKNRSTKPKNCDSRRSHTVYYYIMSSSQSSKVQVCKKAFLSIHGLQTNRGRLENVVKTIKDGSLTPKLDGRGAHGKHKKNIVISRSSTLKRSLKGYPNMRAIIRGTITPALFS